MSDTLDSLMGPNRPIMGLFDLKPENAGIHVNSSSFPIFIPQTYFLSSPQTLHWRKAVGGQDMKLEVKLGCALPQLPVGAPPSWVAARRKGGKGRGGGRGCRQQGNI